MRVAPKIELEPAMRKRLLRYSKASNISVKLRIRARMILLAADGMTNMQIAERIGVDRLQVGRWRSRFAAQGLAGIEKDKSRPGRIKPISCRKVSEIIHKALHARPNRAAHWSRALMAREVGVSPSSIGRIWARNGIKPHRARTFKLSNDKHFEEKLRDVVGLYLSPPEHAVVLSCDEKSQIQALDRTQPGLPLKKGCNAPR